jgi:hypothetical protein
LLPQSTAVAIEEEWWWRSSDHPVLISRRPPIAIGGKPANAFGLDELGVMPVHADAVYPLDADKGRRTAFSLYYWLNTSRRPN